MDVGDFLHLQAALQADGVVDSPANQVSVLGVCIFGRKPLDTLLILQGPLHLLRQTHHLLDISGVLLLADFLPHQGELYRQGIAGNQLGAVGLCGCHGDFRPRQGVKYIVRLPGNGASHHIDDGQGPYSLLLGKAQGRQGVSRLPRLTDDHHQGVGVQERSAVAELRGQLHPDGDFCQILNHILGRNPYMVGGAAGHKLNLGDRTDFLVRQMNLRQVNVPVLYHRVQGIQSRSGLLVDFLHHEMLVAALFRSFRIPFDFRQLFFNLFPIQVVEMDLPRRQSGHLQIADVVDAPGVLQNSRNVGSHIGFPVRHPDNHGAFLPGRPDFSGIVLKHHAQSVGTSDPHHGLRQGVHRAQIVFFIIIVNQLHHHFRVRIGIETVAVL